MVGNLSELMMGKVPLTKYVDPGNPTVTLYIVWIQISNVLVDLGASIKVMTIETLKQLVLSNIRPTPTILEMAHRSTIKLEGFLDDILVFVDSWEYPTNFVVLHHKSQLGGNPLIFGRPWLATTYAYINCRSGSMKISDGSAINNLNLYPPSKLSINMETSLWMDLEEEKDIKPLSTIGKALTFKT